MSLKLYNYLKNNYNNKNFFTIKNIKTYSMGGKLYYDHTTQEINSPYIKIFNIGIFYKNTKNLILVINYKKTISKKIRNLDTNKDIDILQEENFKPEELIKEINKKIYNSI